jgi:hypothetical protein
LDRAVALQYLGTWNQELGTWNLSIRTKLGLALDKQGYKCFIKSLEKSGSQG